MKKSLQFMTRSWDLKGKSGEWMARRLARSPKPNIAQKKMAKLALGFLN